LNTQKLANYIFPIPRIWSILIGARLSLLDCQPYKSNKIYRRGNEKVQSIVPIQTYVMQTLNSGNKKKNYSRTQQNARNNKDNDVLVNKSFIHLKQAQKVNKIADGKK